MVTPSTRRPSTAADAPSCRRCHGRGWFYLEAGADRWPYEVACTDCADDDRDDDDDCRAGDDTAESCPDDAGRWSAVARFPTGAAA